MEFNFSVSRLLQFVALVTAFWWFGGFTIEQPREGFHDSGRVTKAWMYCVILFLTGAGSASLIDHFVGNLDRWNMRVAYIILGALLMVGSCLWLAGLKKTVAIGE